MYCDGCGTVVQPGQVFCGKCGKQILGTISVVQGPGRVQQHSHLLAILWLAMSAFNSLGGVVLLLLGTTLFPHSFLTSLFMVLGILVLGKAACGFLAGWGLMRREPWARVLALVLAFISLFNIPFGTAIGVYTMWVLLPGGSQQEYDALDQARAA